MHKIDLINFLRDFFQIYIAPCRCQLNLSHARCVRKSYISSLVLGWLLSLLQKHQEAFEFRVLVLCVGCVFLVTGLFTMDSGFGRLFAKVRLICNFQDAKSVL